MVKTKKRNYSSVKKINFLVVIFAVTMILVFIGLISNIASHKTSSVLGERDRSDDSDRRNSNRNNSTTPTPSLSPSIILTVSPTTIVNIPSVSVTEILPTTTATYAVSTLQQNTQISAPTYQMETVITPTSSALDLKEPTSNVPSKSISQNQTVSPTITAVMKKTTVKSTTNSIINSIKTQFQSWGIGVARPAAKPKVEEKIQDPEGISEKMMLIYGVDMGQVTMSVQTESGGSVALSDDEIERMSIAVSASLQKIGVNLTISPDGKTTLSKQGVLAESNYPISVDLEMKEVSLFVEGERQRIKIYPDQVISILREIDPLFSPASDTSPMQIQTLNGEAVYAVYGLRKYKIFGVVDSSAGGTDYISAETGELVLQTRSVVGNVVRLFSI